MRRRVCDQDRGRAVVAMAAKTGGEEKAQELSVLPLMPAQEAPPDFRVEYDVSGLTYASLTDA